MTQPESTCFGRGKSRSYGSSVKSPISSRCPTRNWLKSGSKRASVSSTSAVVLAGSSIYWAKGTVRAGTSLASTAARNWIHRPEEEARETSAKPRDDVNRQRQSANRHARQAADRRIGTDGEDERTAARSMQPERQTAATIAHG